MALARRCLTHIKMKSKRCDWCGDDPLYVKYHDEEWGRLVEDDRKMFEFLVLESAQAGLSWITILRKRENYRKAFAKFDAKRVAKFDAADVERLMNDPGIVRNRLKINAAISNARCFLAIQKDSAVFVRIFAPSCQRDSPLSIVGRRLTRFRRALNFRMRSARI